MSPESSQPEFKHPDCRCGPNANAAERDACELARRYSVENAAAAPPFDFELLGKSIGRVVNTKQAAYGDSFGKCGAVMAILYPEGIPPEKLGDALAVVRVLDKLFRIATDRDALGEDPWRDVAGYALLSAARVEAKR